MGNTQNNDSNEQKQTNSSKMHKKMNNEVNKECQHIDNICNKHENLKLLQTKLAILELQTFKTVKYSRNCANSKCKQKAPDTFNKLDVFICSNHLQEIKQYFDTFTKKYDINSEIDNINKKSGDNTKKEIINRIFYSFQRVGTSFNGSINIQSKQPQNYWSLLMTKLLTVLRYLTISKTNSYQNNNLRAITLTENLLKLMVLYRYVMNPIGDDILEFISVVTKYIIDISSTIIDAVPILDQMVETVVNSVLFGYATTFIRGIATAYRENRDTVSGLAIVAGGALIGGFAGPIGAMTGAGVGLVCVGTFNLIRSLLADVNQNPVAAGHQVLTDMTQNIQQLQQNNNLQQLQQQLQQLQQAN